MGALMFVFIVILVCIVLVLILPTPWLAWLLKLLGSATGWLVNAVITKIINATT